MLDHIQANAGSRSAGCDLGKREILVKDLIDGMIRDPVTLVTNLKDDGFSLINQCDKNMTPPG